VTRPIRRLLPPGPEQATDEQLLAWYGELPRPGPWVRFNFVASLDGASTYAGRSGTLGDEVDQRVFLLLRRLADVLVVGAGTIRAEGYGGELLSVESQAWRLARGMSAHPPVAVVSASLDLDPGSAFFTAAPVRPIVLTSAASPATRRRALEPVADVLDAGTTRVEPARVVEALAARGYEQIHSEGGPFLFGSFQAAGLVDELCLTISPVLAGGTAKRISDHLPGARESLQRLQLRQVLESGSMLLLRYTAADSAPGTTSTDTGSLPTRSPSA
jgi:riboflavin biosynthesis pyrimidine reductase